MYSPLVAGADIIVVRDAHWAIVPALLWVAAQGARNGADAAARVIVRKSGSAAGTTRAWIIGRLENERGYLDGFWAFGGRFRPKIHAHPAGIRISTLVCPKIHAHAAGATTAIDIR